MSIMGRAHALLAILAICGVLISAGGFLGHVLLGKPEVNAIWLLPLLFTGGYLVFLAIAISVNIWRDA